MNETQRSLEYTILIGHSAVRYFSVFAIVHDNTVCTLIIIVLFTGWLFWIL